MYVNEAISHSLDKSSLLRLDPIEKAKLEELDSMNFDSLLTSPKTTVEIPTKAYVDSLAGNVRYRRDFSTVFKDQDNGFDNNKLMTLDGITINRNPISHKEFSNKKYIDDKIDKDTIFRFSKNLQKYIRVSVGNNIYNLAKNDEM